MRTVTVMTIALYDVPSGDDRLKHLAQAMLHLAALGGIERPPITFVSQQIAGTAEERAAMKCCGGSGFADYAAVPCPNPSCPTKAVIA